MPRIYIEVGFWIIALPPFPVHVPAHDSAKLPLAYLLTAHAPAEVALITTCLLYGKLQRINCTMWRDMVPWISYLGATDVVVRTIERETMLGYVKRQVHRTTAPLTSLMAHWSLMVLVDVLKIVIGVYRDLPSLNHSLLLFLRNIVQHVLV